MESVAVEAGVSRGLVYAYFANRAGLVHELWDEVSGLWDVEAMPLHEEILGSKSLRQLFDERVVSNTRWFLDQVECSGLLFHRLQAEPVLESSVAEVRKRVEHDNIEWWARLVEAMGVERERALVFSALVNAPSQVMWGLLAHDQASREAIEDVFFLMCGAALDQLLAEERSEIFCQHCRRLTVAAAAPRGEQPCNITIWAEPHYASASCALAP